MAAVFRPMENGYDQMEVLTRIDALEELKGKVRKGKLTVEEAVQQARALVENPIPTSNMGFAMEEVDVCFENYLGAISGMNTVTVRAEAERPTLRTAFKGYAKTETLMRIDLLNAFILSVKDGTKDPAEALASAEAIVRKPLKTEFFGFSVSETDEYFENLLRRLRSFV